MLTFLKKIYRIIREKIAEINEQLEAENLYKKYNKMF